MFPVRTRPLFHSRPRCHNVTMARVFLNDNWLPKSVLCLRDYDRHKFLLDLIAGITVGLVALPRWPWPLRLPLG